MRTARVQALASHLPDTVLANEELAALYPGWTAEKIVEKTGVRERRIAAPDETAADLACHAARKLFDRTGVAPGDIDFLLFCTQAPDYILPTTACILQDRLGLPTSCGALDFNLGCSGFVYGLALAKGLIETGAANRVLLLTADTYSRFIHPLDKSVRTLFGDGAAATLIEAVEAERPMIGPFVFGADGRGAPNLIVPTGGARRAPDAASAIASEDESGNIRSADNLLMKGPEIVSFTLKAVPPAIDRLLAEAHLTLDDIDLFVFHQASAFILDKLRKKIGIPPERFVIKLETCGNTVSSTIPIALEDQFGAQPEERLAMLVGFGVGYSWAATCVRF
ncbi:3-oxoacyl-ACP synthase III family protein [Phenylobacterium sp.]|uniref:3-oxoacyl-ACP synthase III family protein n=1 Tax=Phenylobacterium sp. TaxID=1871053 RepID=UPI00121B451E|nr:ketoacyl-ACP synthase III [Phenylobacterium sp.]THD64090.1 MAG: ketoacyl-ACP synthase III [Phenylobacterium sp.]